FGRQFERLPEARYNEFGFPDVAVGWYDWVVSFDHAANRAWVLSSGYPRTRPNTWQTRARNRIQFVLDHLSDDSPPLPRVTHFVDPSPTRVGPPGLAPQYPLPDFPGVTSNFDRAGYEAAVARAIEYIHAGDCYQVNLSQRLLAPLREHPLELYGRLRRLNPAPFAA